MKAALASTVLGKRTVRGPDDSLVLHLTPDPPATSSTNPGGGQEYNNYDLHNRPTSSSKGPHMIINGALVENTKKRYCCTHEGCGKAYTKPSRLEEHERSHTGQVTSKSLSAKLTSNKANQRPFICEICGNSYLRETHLHAHARSHLPASSRPLQCERGNCGKRFWTSQHLKTHLLWHDGAKPYECNVEDCHEAFSKHHQLRAHICGEHAPPGTKPYRCEHEGCSKSFDTNQHLKTHQKTHEDKRYACVHFSCLSNALESPPYFPTWSALQSHIRKNHPPTCSHASCNGRTFANQSNLRAHLKLHEQREVDHALEDDLGFGSDLEMQPRKRRRGGEYGREFKCQVLGCEKEFKSEKALAIHTKVTHLGNRDFVCHNASCSRSFGYKHLLQRHISKVHRTGNSVQVVSEEALESKDEDSDFTFDVDTITGNAYAKRAEANVKHAKALRCPFPQLNDLAGTSDCAESIPPDTPPCDYVFNRGYDLRRHLKACHEVVSFKDVVDGWVKRQKVIAQSASRS